MLDQYIIAALAKKMEYTGTEDSLGRAIVICSDASKEEYCTTIERFFFENGFEQTDYAITPLGNNLFVTLKVQQERFERAVALRNLFDALERCYVTDSVEMPDSFMFEGSSRDIHTILKAMETLNDNPYLGLRQPALRILDSVRMATTGEQSRLHQYATQAMQSQNELSEALKRVSIRKRVDSAVQTVRDVYKLSPVSNQPDDMAAFSKVRTLLQRHQFEFLDLEPVAGGIPVMMIKPGYNNLLIKLLGTQTVPDIPREEKDRLMEALQGCFLSIEGNTCIIQGSPASIPELDGALNDIRDDRRFGLKNVRMQGKNQITITFENNNNLHRFINVVINGQNEILDLLDACTLRISKIPGINDKKYFIESSERSELLAIKAALMVMGGKVSDSGTEVVVPADNTGLIAFMNKAMERQTGSPDTGGPRI